ncbi:Hypothetical predicted protein [Marmota monax]|nr:Hypothetical predicted protein [Marmota monax]
MRDRKRLLVETGLDFRQRRGLVGEGLVPVPPPPGATLCHTSPGEADVPLTPRSPPPASVAPEGTRARRCLCRHLTATSWGSVLPHLHLSADLRRGLSPALRKDQCVCNSWDLGTLLTRGEMRQVARRCW